MTVSNTTSQSGPYTPNGVTVSFPFTFHVLSAGELLVVRRNEDGQDTVIPTGYTVTGTLPGDSGNVVFDVAPAAGDPIYLLPNPNFEQNTDLINQGSYSPTSIEHALDRLAATDIYQQEKLARAILVPPGETPEEITSISDIVDAVLEQVTPEALSDIALAGDAQELRLVGIGDAQETRLTDVGDQQEARLVDVATVQVGVINTTADSRVAEIAATPGSDFYNDTAEGLAANPVDGDLWIVKGDNTSTAWLLYQTDSAVIPDGFSFMTSSPSLAFLQSLAEALAETPFDVRLLRPRLTTEQILGAPVPVDGANGTDISRVRTRRFGLAGHAMGIWAFGRNGGGTVYISIWERDDVTTALGNNPFTTTNASATVTVAHVAHGLAVNDRVTFAVAAVVGGLDLNNEYFVASVPTADTYTITASSAATSAETGGGAAVTERKHVLSRVEEREVAIPAGLAYTAFDTPLEFTADQMWGDYGGGSGAAHRFAVVSNGVPRTDYYSASGHVSTMNRKTVTTNSSVQVGLVCRFGDGEIQAGYDSIVDGVGRTVIWGRDVDVVDAGSDLSDGDAHIPAQPFPVSGRIKRWSIGAGKVGPMLSMLVDKVGGGRLSIRWMMAMQLTQLGKNDFQTADGSLPENLRVVRGRTFRMYLCTTAAASGAISYRTGGALVDSEGYEFEATFTGDMWGEITPTRLPTVDRVYEDEFEIEVPVHPGNVGATTDQTVFDIDFTDGDPIDGFDTAGTYAFTADGLVLLSAGVANGMFGTWPMAFDRQTIGFWFRMGGSLGNCDEALIGLSPDGMGIYGTGVKVDVPNQRISFHQWQGTNIYTTGSAGSGGQGNAYADVTDPFNAAFDYGTWFYLRIRRWEDDVDIWLHNSGTKELAQADAALDAYVLTDTQDRGTSLSRLMSGWEPDDPNSEGDYADIGKGVGVVSARPLVGTGLTIKRVRGESPDFLAQKLLEDDSMARSRARYREAFAGRLRDALSEVGERLAMTAIDGTTVTDSRRRIYKMIAWMPNLNCIAWGQGMNDLGNRFVGGLTEATAKDQVNMVFNRADRLGITKNVLIEVFPTVILVGNTDNNTGNELLNVHYRTMAEERGYDIVGSWIQGSDPAAVTFPGTRNEDGRFMPHPDPHPAPLGHGYNFDQAALEAPNLGISGVAKPRYFVNP